MSKGKCLLKKEAKEFSENFDKNDHLLGRLIELNRKLEFATPPKPLSDDERSRFDRRKRGKFLPKDLTEAKNTNPIEEKTKPKPTEYAKRLIEKKKIKEAKSKGKKRDRPKRGDPNYGTKKGEKERKAQVREVKQTTAVEGGNPAIKSKKRKELDLSPSQAKKQNPRHPRVTGKIGEFRKGSKAGSVSPSERVGLPETQSYRRVSDLPDHAKKELARKMRNTLSNKGISRGLKRTELMISKMSIGKLLKVLGMNAVNLAKIIKK